MITRKQSFSLYSELRLLLFSWMLISSIISHHSYYILFFNSSSRISSSFLVDAFIIPTTKVHGSSYNTHGNINRIVKSSSETDQLLTAKKLLSRHQISTELPSSALQSKKILNNTQRRQEFLVDQNDTISNNIYSLTTNSSKNNLRHTLTCSCINNKNCQCENGKESDQHCGPRELLTYQTRLVRRQESVAEDKSETTQLKERTLKDVFEMVMLVILVLVVIFFLVFMICKDREARDKKLASCQRNNNRSSSNDNSSMEQFNDTDNDSLDSPPAYDDPDYIIEPLPIYRSLSIKESDFEHALSSVSVSTYQSDEIMVDPIADNNTHSQSNLENSYRLIQTAETTQSNVKVPAPVHRFAAGSTF